MVSIHNIMILQMFMKYLLYDIPDFHAQKGILSYSCVASLACRWRFGLHHDIRRIQKRGKLSEPNWTLESRERSQNDT